MRAERPITFAHRGARLEEPENTLRAFRRALDHGASGLETDVWLSADGEVVCTHDATVRSGIRRRKVATSTAADLAALEVPRVVEVYEALGTDFEFSIDVKTPEAAGPLFEVAERFGAAERLWACTPNLEELKAWREVTPAKLVHSTHKRAIGVPMERHANDLAELGIETVNMHHTEWTAGLVSLMHRFGLRAFAWDVQEARNIRAVLTMGIDAIYCDRPDRMVATVAEWS
jgi:glycerophosphoryl diester phosphodiesterase